MQNLFQLNKKIYILNKNKNLLKLLFEFYRKKNKHD